MLAIALIVIGFLSRVLVHEPNFTPILAIALFAGVYLSKRLAVIVPLALMIVADLVVGMHSLVLFTWGCMALIAFMGMSLKKNKSWGNIAISSTLAAFLFFIVTNFGVWLLMPTYPKSMAGILECYTMAIPYFRNTLLSTLIYSFALFGIYEFMAARVKGTKFANVL